MHRIGKNRVLFFVFYIYWVCFLAGSVKDIPIVTPLMDFVRQKRAAKGPRVIFFFLHMINLLSFKETFPLSLVIMSAFVCVCVCLWKFVEIMNCICC